MRIPRTVWTALFLVLPAAVLTAPVEWSQWGGPNRNFKLDAAPLKTTWPAAGPTKVWQRPLGEGYSSVVTSGTSLYTSYRRDQQDVLVALDTNTGKTQWELPLDAPHKGTPAGPGPHSSPLIVNDRLYFVTMAGHLYALDRRTGKRIWSHDLIKEYGGSELETGFSMSPIAHGDTIIVAVGGQGHAMMAFRQSDGGVVWQKGDFMNSPSSPLFLRIDGRQQLVNFMGRDVAGFDPANGTVLWSHPHRTQYDLNITPPAWCEEDGVLVVASGYDGGARGIRPSASGAKELWHHKRLRVHHANMLCTGGVVYGSSGDFGPAPLTAVDAKTGQVLWQDRTFSKANLLQIGDMVLLLDEDGTLALVRLSREGAKVLTQAQIVDQRAWTAPTLVGNRLYVRDRRNIMALDLP